MKKIGFVGGISWTSTLDYYQYFPKKRESEGLMIDNGKYYRVFANGEMEEMK
jgi:aspartate/glutamate racemase